MKRSTELLGGAAFALFFVALTGWLFCLAKINVDFTAMHIAYLPLALAALAGYAINLMLMRRGAPIRLYVLVQVAMVAGAAALFVHSVSLEPYKVRTVILNCIIYCIVFPASGFVAYEPLKKIALLVFFDCSAAGIAILLLLGHYMELLTARPTVILCGVVMAVTLLALISERAGRYHAGQESVQGSAVGGRILLGVLFAAVVGLTALIAAAASVGIRNVAAGLAAALRWLWSGVLAVLRFLYRALEAFMVWLSQFAKDTPMEPIPGPEMGGSADFAAENVQVALPPWVTWAAIGVGALLLALILWRARKHHFTRNIRIVRRPTAVRRESNAGEALRELLQKLRAELRFRADCILRRNTAPGLLVWCERKAPKADARRSGESGEKFLLRLAEQPECAPLRELAALVERSFYASGRVTVPRELCRAIRKIKFT